MKLTFYGACHEVTGSMYLLEVNEKNILIDCGMEQGVDCFENQELKVSPAKIDAVIVTHAHIDHTGKIPLLIKEGFEGKIYATGVTKALCEIMLRDSAHIQESEVEWKNRKRMRKNQPPIDPLYSMEHAESALMLFEPLSYGEEKEIFPGVVLSYIDAGHLLGSGSAKLTLTEKDQTRTVVFSGDIGNMNQPILKDPVRPTQADYVVMESTYGDRTHDGIVDYVSILTDILKRTFARGGNVVVPSFAVGRTQEMLYFLRQIKEQGLLGEHNDFKVYVDSPLAIQATNIFHESDLQYFDKDATDLIQKGINPIMFDGLITTISAEESKTINYITEPKVILSASGMCEAGRIRHHLKHNLYRSESTILFVGYQGVGTIGRALLEGAKEVKLFGESIAVAAEITRMPSISSHGDCNMLEAWVKNIAPQPKRVFVTHGDDEVCDIFARRLQDNLGLTATAPYSSECWDLIENTCLKKGVPVPLEKKKTAQQNAPAGVSGVYAELLSKAEELSRLAGTLEGRANRDIKEFTAQIEELIKRWK